MIWNLELDDKNARFILEAEKQRILKQNQMN